MESSNRNNWVLIIIVAVVVACCCLAALVAAAGGLAIFPIVERRDRGVVIERELQVEQVPVGAEQLDEVLAVGDAPTIEVVNFAGSIDVVTGTPGEVHLIATKQAPGAPDLSDVQVLIEEQDGGLRIVTRKPATLMNASVRIELTVPDNVELIVDSGAGDVNVRGVNGGVDIQTGAGVITVQGLAGGVNLFTGAGQISVRDVIGSLDAETGAGTITIEAVDGAVDARTGTGTVTVRGVVGPVRMDSGVGALEYSGTPEGECRFTTGMGQIVLRLQENVDAQVDLSTGMGQVQVDFPVDGDVERDEVRGTIGTGQGAQIYAETGNGDIRVVVN